MLKMPMGEMRLPDLNRKNRFISSAQRLKKKRKGGGQNTLRGEKKRGIRVLLFRADAKGNLVDRTDGASSVRIGGWLGKSPLGDGLTEAIKYQTTKNK